METEPSFGNIKNRASVIMAQQKRLCRGSDGYGILVLLLLYQYGILSLDVS